MFDRAAQRILDVLGERGPDLSAATVLLPHLHAAGPLAAALARLSGLPAIIPPRFLTLADWAESAPVAVAVSSDSARQITLYRALKSRRWFDEMDLWPLTRQLLLLFNELTLNRVALPESVERFTDELARAYRAKASQPLQFEARLVHEMWYALASGATMDRSSRHGAGLAWQAGQISAPLFTLGLSRLAGIEEEALQRAADRVPVIQLSLHRPDDPVAQALETAWPAALDTALLTRAHDLARVLPHNPLTNRVRLFGARHLEEEAEAAALQIRMWLSQGCNSIGLVAQDRLAARRVRALLERSRIRVHDESGWQLSTTSAASMVMTWVQTVAHKFRFETVLNLLKSPRVMTDDTRLRSLACRQMEKALVAHGPASGKAELIQRLNQAEQNQPAAEARAALDRLVDAARPLAGASFTLSEWLAHLMTSLKILQTDLEEDAAGKQVIGLLRLRGDELKQDTGRFTRAEFHRWLSGELEAASFVEQNIDSPVVFTHLAAARLRPFDGVILLGAEADRLPGAAAAGFFNQRVRNELGLPGHADTLKETQADLLSLLGTSHDTLVIWRAREAGENVALSPWFERLDALSQQAWGSSLHDTSLSRWLAQSAIKVAPNPGTPAPLPRPTSIPGKVSVSAYNSLIACPYQYFARHILKLNEEDDISAEVDKADYGSFVHQILYRFHNHHPQFSALPDAELIADLQRETRRAFSEPEAQDWFSQAWRLRWESRMPAYIQWQKQRELEGWLWHEGEKTSEQDFQLPGGGTVMLHGRVDRIDRRADELAVLDYKTESPQGLKEKQNSAGEDVQLACYALLLGEDVSATAFVSLEAEGGPKTLDSAVINAKEESRRLLAVFDALHQGAQLPAQGIEKACMRCEMRGLCRRDYWRDRRSND
ncbi:MAG: PD-(D/E)XK nuclease family protein [Thiobacillaceae bacterium]